MAKLLKEGHLKRRRLWQSAGAIRKYRIKSRISRIPGSKCVEIIVTVAGSGEEEVLGAAKDD